MAEGVEMNEQFPGGFLRPGFEREVANAFSQLTDQLGHLSTTVANQGISQNIPPFDGKSKDFYAWVKSIEKFCTLTNVPANNYKLVAYNSSRDTVSSFIARYMNQFPRGTWENLKTELSSRFGEVVDESHAAVLLRKVKQKEGEPIQSYAERLITLAEQAFTNQNRQAETQLVGYFIDSLYYDHLKMKVLRINPPTLDEAVNCALYDQNLRKRFNLRSGRDYKSLESNDEPMDVSHVRPRMCCQRCHRSNHSTKDCRASIRPQINAVNTQQVSTQYHNWGNQQSNDSWDYGDNRGQRQQNMTGVRKCWICGSDKHLKRNCPGKQNMTSNRNSSNQQGN